MGRFSTKTATKKSSVVADEGIVLNRAGGKAYALSPKEELVSAITTTMLGKEYYESADERVQRILDLVAKEPEFAAKAAVWVRDPKNNGLRSVTHLVAAEVGHLVKGEAWTRKFFDRVVYRVDDMTEIVAAYMSRYGKPLPNSMKKGLASAFGKFDEFQLGRYRGEGNAVSLVDLVNLVHPTPTPKNGEALKMLVEGTLRASERTFEVAVSKAGQGAKTEKEKVAAKEEAWTKLVLEGSLGYLALLRNLRNIATTTDKAVLNAALEQLTDEKAIVKAGVFPFQYLIAYDVAGSANSRIKKAINKAVEYSLQNVPALENTLVVVDHSGSMSAPLDRGRAGGYPVTRSMIADVFGAMLFKRCDGDFMVFGSYAGYYHDRLDAGDGVFSIAQKMGTFCEGHSTNMSAVFEKAAKPYDRIAIFSDMQTWVDNSSGYGYSMSNSNPAYKNYCRKFDVVPYIYNFDLAGYGDTQILGNNVCQLYGWSDKVFDFMKSFEVKPSDIVAEIEKAIVF